MPPAARGTSAEGGKRASRKHASKSCSSCRRRKVRCSGSTPCDACVLYHEECSYDEKHDGRKPASKAFVAALEKRVKDLEAILQSHGLDATTTGFEAEALIAGPSLETDREDDVNRMGIQQLKIDDTTGEYRLYGHASQFMHLSAHDPLASSSALAPSPPSARPPASSRGSTTFLCPDHPDPHSSTKSPSPAEDLEMSSGEGIDWARHLPEVEGMDEALHNELLELFFLHFNSWASFVNEALFRRDMASCLSTSTSSTPIRTAYYSPLLHLSLLAVACAYSPRILDAEIYAERAKTRIEVESEAALLSSIQGLFLLADYYAGAARHKIGYLYYGIANFSASNLGLAVSLEPLEQRQLVSSEVRRERERTFCTWLLQDKLWGCYLGRAPHLSADSYETSLPAIDAEEDQLPWRASLSNTSLVPGYRSSTLHHAGRLMTTLERILRLLYSFKSRLYASSVIAKVSAFHVELERWYAELPSAIAISPYSRTPPPSHIITLHCTYWFISILLHRPYYTRVDGKELLPVNRIAVKHCERAASKIVNLLEMHRASPGLRYSTITLTQVTFLAGTVHLLSAINSSDAPKRFATSLAASEDCQRALREMGQSWKCAIQSAEILRRLTEEWCGTSATGEEGRLGLGGGVKRARPEEEDEKAPMDLHRNLWDSSWGRLADMETPESLPRLPNLPTQAESSQAPYVINLYNPVPPPAPAPIPPYQPPPSFGRYQPPPAPSPALPTSFFAAPTPSFTRYQPPQATLPPSVDPTFAPTFPSFSSTAEPFSFGHLDTSNNVPIDPFSSVDIFSLLQGGDGSSLGMPMEGWAGQGLGGAGVGEDELPQWLRDLGLQN